MRKSRKPDFAHSFEEIMNASSTLILNLYRGRLKESESEDERGDSESIVRFIHFIAGELLFKIKSEEEVSGSRCKCASSLKVTDVSEVALRLSRLRLTFY